MGKNRLKLPKVEATPEDVYLNRRKFIEKAGLGTIGVAAGVGVGMGLLGEFVGGERLEAAVDLSEIDPAILRPGVEREEILKLFPAKRNEKYVLPPNTEITELPYPMVYNNFYEFTTDKQRVWMLAKDFDVDPWTVEVTGECHKPQKFGLEDLFKIDQEERLYRHRCVEAWAMDVPWTGFSLSKLLAKVDPKASAKFVRFETAVDKKTMVGVTRDPSTRHYPFPYWEGLRMDEAMNELTLVTTGMYGKPLTRQNGAPVRIVVPWKYGYKSPKSIVKIELTRTNPSSLWTKLQPAEYPFESNVEPHVPHPRWSQASEKVLPTMERRPTLLYNGYGEYVAGLYKK
jgi:sulfoxide reductase catalytic subunit YedY